MKVVTICGSMKFAEDMQKIATELETKNGWCVIQCCYGIDTYKLTKKEMDNIVNAHWKKIDISDAVYVVNIGGYIGNATKNEIEYAKEHNKEIIYHDTNLKFSFKLNFKDGATKMVGGKSSSPENLKYDFDGMLPWEEYYSFSDSKRTPQDVVNLAKVLYSKHYNNLDKVEIINIQTDEIIISSD